MVTDFRHSVPVRYDKVLPDLFREGAGVVAHGRLDASGTFVADEVLAKHDEKYMPPEVARSLQARHEQRTPRACRRGALMLVELGHYALILALLLAGGAGVLRPGRAGAAARALARGGAFGRLRPVRVRRAGGRRAGARLRQQ